ncbi:unnamed protein product [Haemonchus placei]|uniref:Lipoprotein n=1 Tax=Haemonchus placei TaxID=6290 RepID=A0A0N4X2J2_HAEPC|nr:unnamed protein product [Haemonchus placei]
MSLKRSLCRFSISLSTLNFFSCSGTARLMAYEPQPNE